MSIYAISDLHLSFNDDKPMNVFGENWDNHEEKIEKNWIDTVKEDDLVILPGDFSWAMHLKDTLNDFKFLNRLPGKKVLIKGNHDYWWTTLKSMNDFLYTNKIEDVSFILNNAFLYKDTVVVGTRGWAFTETENSEKMHKRELMRLENSIKYAIEKYGSDKKIICAMHYPPITKNMVNNNEISMYVDLMKNNSIKNCIYGHLHGKSHQEAVEGSINGIELKLVSCDYLNFKLYKINMNK